MVELGQTESGYYLKSEEESTVRSHQSGAALDPFLLGLYDTEDKLVTRNKFYQLQILAFSPTESEFDALFSISKEVNSERGVFNVTGLFVGGELGGVVLLSFISGAFSYDLPSTS